MTQELNVNTQGLLCLPIMLDCLIITEVQRIFWSEPGWIFIQGRF